MKKIKYEFICDLCGTSESTSLPGHWVELSIENKYVDREFTEKHICDECSLEIKKLHTQGVKIK